ncbi:MAG TPA: zinc-ribbon domain containing protein [Candidatus Saccharimonadales bacterium]|nr:zinc-ribbon domain containing protein [Candidatus Saccharimonadales bacterium]
MGNQTATCASCQKQFLIIEQEQKFLNDKNLPLPSNCPSCRQLRRLRLRGERQLYRTKCQKCQKDIVVSYDPTKVKNMILCKEDFEKYYEENDPIVTDPLPEI